jgi:hypothetical protein
LLFLNFFLLALTKGKQRLPSLRSCGAKGKVGCNIEKFFINKLSAKIKKDNKKTKQTKKLNECAEMVAG